MEKGVRRWLVDISKWNPSRDEFSFLVSLFPPDEHSSITRFVKFEDRKRAIVSRLLQYALVNEVLGIPFNEIIIRRTIEGKPYLESKENLEFPNFNFNVSHHGDYVGIASEPLCLVGLDIVSHFIPRHETSLEYLANFSPYLSRLEWDSIVSAGTSDQILAEFYRYWCLKEAFVKAIGAGVGYRLDQLEFHHTDWSGISVHIDGEESTEWKFFLFELGGKRHWVSVAKGHPRMAITSYKRTLKCTEFELDEHYLRLQLPITSIETCSHAEDVVVTEASQNGSSLLVLDHTTKVPGTGFKLCFNQVQNRNIS
ncbi:L-aminoadipate-semialdehyde dehydrogenase-phosphopantetheinyl transferase-like isoform X2 [Macadamia integrifolia]|uniref:L-aminoadipate-semialdehyde dehydrogenase-phosphopantetheinyl transferase-like isoform X2 n=1 Tax=Macadamia integrifolia TaxID=60698 RepID=UPI001C4EDEE4|nr:L-aminoadipate-semialdehyde dehydrogenase-phosphopantetheinyl transferase-like isoform X2 [Macadamia integrifolia]